MNGGTMQGNGFWTDLKDWSRHPFSADMPIWPDYVMLIGITIVIVILWNILLRHLFNALGEV